MRKLGLQRDLAEAAALERRRRGELHRQSRIFDARVRTVGVDKDALDTQINDKKIQEANEKARHETIAGEMTQNDKIICMLEGRQKQDIKNLNKAVTEFQQNFQKPETRREFDLSDPQALKKDTPARLSDNDPRCTVSGLQKFLGEDLNHDQRVKFQKEQSREWSLQQQRDWKNALADQKFAEDLHDKNRIELDQKAMELQRKDVETRQAVCAAIKDFNRTQAVEFAERKMLEKRQEEEDNVAEISNLLQGDLLTENPEQAASSFGRHRVITDRWKGMNQDQLKAIHYTQQQQVLEKLRLQEEERQRNAEWDRQRIQAARAQLLFERHQQRLNRELRRTLDNANAQLSQEQKSKKIYLQEEVYSNFPTVQYFTQFNTTSR
ncbi:RIB43A-like with coiled-coils protein 2 isoform X1 [Dermochelys coriacea]|uniref:RIB43A-like with coiled-coils protein 2 isoform X1 n=2 Tax=Dermochelys coriacea TaxID=27794 RepID=UPI0018E72064|nr:RIB43A-like with coiled-coils protein 2 isoform X1 [Dermochelys coriacea]XP_038231927.1 RIB43A-like with coiled-coils protein 2 isoform X1 [Dermochelys coriacea]